MWKVIVIFMISFVMIRARNTELGKEYLSRPDNAITCAPYFTYHMVSDIYLKDGEEYQDFLCLASGTPALNFKWEKDGVDLYKGATWRLNHIRPEHEGNYTCLVCNNYGCIHQTTRLHVEIEPLKLKTNLKNDTVKIGQSYSGFHCIHNKPENQVTVEWYPHMAKEIKPINDLPDEVLEKKSDVDSEFYEIRNVTKQDEGWYLCRVYTRTEIKHSSAYLTVVSKNADDSRCDTRF